MGRAQLLARVDPAILAAQPLAIEQVRAGELRTQPGAAQPLDRLAIQLVGGRRPRSAAPGSAPRCRARNRCRRAASSRPAARARRGRARRRLRARPPRRARAAPTWISSGRRRPRWPAGPPMPPPRSGRGRCTGRRPPSAPESPPCPAPPNCSDRCRDRCGGLGFPPLQRPEPQQGVGREAAPGRRRDAVDLRDERGGTREVAHPDAGHREIRQVDRQRRERAGVADDLDLSSRRRRTSPRRPTWRRWRRPPSSPSAGRPPRACRRAPVRLAATSERRRRVPR